MSFITLDHLHLQRAAKIEDLTRNASVANNPRRSISNISSTCITKTISSHFLKPDKIPQAFEERRHGKNITSKPFFTKNRRVGMSNHRSYKAKGKATMLSNSFENMLKTKSTVVKHKKLQEFYINREGRDEEVQQIIPNKLD
jgi:hypothetical protein